MENMTTVSSTTKLSVSGCMIIMFDNVFSLMPPHSQAKIPKACLAQPWYTEQRALDCDQCSASGFMKIEHRMWQSMMESSQVMLTPPNVPAPSTTHCTANEGSPHAGH